MMTRIKQFMGAGVPVLALIGMLMAAPAIAVPPESNTNAPNFMPAIYADGETWGTKGTTVLPEPVDANEQSFDNLYIFVGDAAMGQLPVSEAGPGNPNYNGGRWATVAVMWLAGAAAAHGGNLPVLTSEDDILAEVMDGHLSIGGHPMGPPPYFQCPLLPVLN